MSVSLNSCYWLITLGRDNKVRSTKVFRFGSLKKNHFHWFQTRVKVRFLIFREWLRNISCSFPTEINKEDWKPHYFPALIRSCYPFSQAIYLARKYYAKYFSLRYHIYKVLSIYYKSMLQGNWGTHRSFSEFTGAIALKPDSFLQCFHWNNSPGKAVIAEERRHFSLCSGKRKKIILLSKWSIKQSTFRFYSTGPAWPEALKANYEIKLMFRAAEN